MAVTGFGELSKDDYYFNHHSSVITPLSGSQYPQVIPASPGSSIMPLGSLEDSRRAQFTIDGCIKINVVSDAFRQTMSNYWNSIHSSAKRWAWSVGTLSVVCLAGTAALANGLIKTRSPNPLLVPALAISAVASMIFTAIAVYKASKATDEQLQWERNPAQEIANKRAKAYQQGFNYVYDNRLKLGEKSSTAVLLPYEVTHLFDKYFVNFCDRLLSQVCNSDQSKKEWLDQFRDHNPVSKDLMLYAYGNIPPQYDRVATDYMNLESFLKNLSQQFNDLRSQRRQEMKRIKDEIERKRTAALLPFNLVLEHFTEEARKTRDEKLAKLRENETQKRQDVENEYYAAVSKYRAFYAVAIIPVNSYFDSKIQEVKDNYKKIIEQIDRNEHSATAPHYNYAWGLLNYAKKIKDGQQAPFEQKLDMEHLYNIPTPSAPNIEININFFEQAEQNRQGIDSSQYADYLKFVRWRQA